MIYLITSSLFPSESSLYEIITPQEALEMLEKELVWGLDTETRGFDPYTRSLFSVQIGNFENQFFIDTESVDIAIFKDFLENPTRTFVLQNAKFDLRFFYHKGIIIKNVFDTYLAERLLWLGYPYFTKEGSKKAVIHRNREPYVTNNYGTALDDLAMMYLGVTLDKSVRGALHYEGLTERVIQYGADDVKYLIPIKDKQLELLEKEQLLTAIQVENKFVRVLAKTEYDGMRLDVERWMKKMERDQTILNEALAELNAWVLNHGDPRWINIPEPDLFTPNPEMTCKLNWNSSPQLIPFFESLGFDLVTTDKKTGEVKKSIEAKILKPQKYKSDIIGPYVRYSEAFKVVTTWGQNWIDAINKVSGRIHTNFTQLMDTSRLSSGGKDKELKVEYLNFQNIPNEEETRACFIPDDGNMMSAIDYKAQEDYVFTDKSREPNLIDFYNDTKERDGHSFVAKLVYFDELKDVPEQEVQEVAPNRRNLAKRGKFALHYGGNGLTVSKNLNLPVSEGEAFEKNYYKAFPGIGMYFKKVKREAWDRGYVLIDHRTGHKSYIYDWTTLKKIEARLTQDFWEEYRNLKPLYSPDIQKATWEHIPPTHRGIVKTAIVRQLVENFAQGASVGVMANTVWSHSIKGKKEVIVFDINLSKAAILVEVVKHYFKRKGYSERMALNYPKLMGHIIEILYENSVNCWKPKEKSKAISSQA